MGVLDEIVRSKRQTVASQKQVFPETLLRKAPFYGQSSSSLVTSIKSSAHGIIAEFKRRSPSKGDIHIGAKVHDVVSGYTNASVSGISVLTDTPFFGGSLEDLVLARHTSRLPILRKDFIIDAYQIHESKAFGADVILLIARILNSNQIKEFSHLAHSLGLEVLLEIHQQKELNHLDLSNIDLIGINHRNLETFDVHMQHSQHIVETIPRHFTKIAESGIRSVEEIKTLKALGFDGVLIGEYLMRSKNPGEKANQLVQNLYS